MHILRFEPRLESERFIWIEGTLLVFIRLFGQRSWEMIVLDKHDPIVNIPLQADHFICTQTFTEGGSFIADTVAAHVINNAFGGNVHLTPFDDLPSEIKERIVIGTIQ